MINPRKDISTKRINTKLLLVISFIFIFLGRLSFKADAATLYLKPKSQTVYQGDSFLIEIWLDSEGEDVNVVEVNLDFPQKLIEAQDLIKGDSIVKLWVKEPNFSNEEGFISFVGGIPEGFRAQGVIGKIIFLGKEIGKIEVNFKDNSKVLLADGKGTMAKLNFLKGNYEIIEKPENLSKISSRTHPDQNKWYKENTLNLEWDLIEGTEYSFILNKDMLAQPDEIPDKPKGEVEYKNLEDGIYYFHLRQVEKEEGQELKWGPKTIFRAMIDKTIPEEFKLQITEIEGKNYLVFATADKTSGIEYYKILEIRDKQQENWEIGESPYLLKDQTLKSKILVKAVDKADNERIEEISPLPKIIWKDLLPTIILGLGIAGIIFWLINKFRLQILKTKPEDY